MEAYYTRTFINLAKKLHKNQKEDLEKAISVVLKNLDTGTLKKQDLANVKVYKFKMCNQLTLLAYEHDNTKITFLSFGSHENFYRDLKNLI